MSQVPSVPNAEAIRILDEILENRAVDLNLRYEILRLTSLCASLNYFIFDKNFYHKKDGLAMGSPLSPLLAELFMDNFEKNLLSLPHPKIKQIIFSKRFVDHIFCIIDGTERDIQELLVLINDQHRSIKFTLAKNESLNLLDLSISVNQNKASLKVFRKPTYTDQVIPNSISYHVSQKYTAFHALIHNLVNLPLYAQGHEEELNTTKSTASNNGYNACLVDNILRKKECKNSFHHDIPLTNHYIFREKEMGEIGISWKYIL